MPFMLALEILQLLLPVHVVHVLDVGVVPHRGLYLLVVLVLQGAVVLLSRLALQPLLVLYCLEFARGCCLAL